MLNTNIVSNIRKAPRKEKNIRRSIFNELQEGKQVQKYLAEQDRLDKQEHEESLRILEINEEEKRREEEADIEERCRDAYMFGDWDYDFDPFY